jgi:hypothetical protein
MNDDARNHEREEIRKFGRFGPKLYGGTFTYAFRILPAELFLLCESAYIA